MSRSSLFRDTDLTTKTPKRTSKILNAGKFKLFIHIHPVLKKIMICTAKEQMEVKKQEEQTELLFNKSLKVDSDDSDDLEEMVIKRVVPPPLPKGAKRGRKKG